MRAIVFDKYGGPEVLAPQEVADPSAGKGQVLVDVAVAGVNYRDVYERERPGYGAKPPAITGVEGAGTSVESGERVAWTSVPGSYAERVAANPDRLVPIPDGISFEIAAAALLQGMTAHYLANDSYRVTHGDWVLVHAAAGGVGLLLTQIATQLGGRVIACASSEEKRNLAREAGAVEAIPYEGFAERAREITGGDGVAAVYDSVGKTTFLEGFKALRPAGRLILFGSASGQPDPLELSALGAADAAYVQRPTLGTYTRTPALLRERAAAVFQMILQGRLHVRIGKRYGLGDARAAHEDLQSRKTTGKLLLLVR